MLFHPYHRQDSAHLSTRVAIDGRLFNVLLHGIASYHPWAPHITIGFNIPWEVVKESGQGDAAAVVPAPLPSSLPSPCSAPRYEAPIAEAANPLLPSTRFGTSYPEAIHSFNRPLSTNQYISWLYLTRPPNPLPNRPVPVEQAIAVRDRLRPVLRNLATRAEVRHPPRPSANVQMESGEARVKEEEPRAYFAEENQSEIQKTEESSLETPHEGTKPHRGGKRAARMKRQLAGEAGHSKSN
ncbi:hypothetical protein M407DRAFT_28789 [Tulasnella calospora MUT 4182]|uniref:Uncharacterized protein n=1 Tax=Tulasnella calospora MUT 4182 TaxID=1051891 RepID=A0A0C3QBD4_9AGAM|nr:hypothetical protein M407DRAFT_28789 [Tulasnella calospora MUT 4182]